MFTVRGKKEESEKVIKKELINDSCKCEATLQVLLNLKKQFKSPDKIFARLKLQSILNNALASIKNIPQERELLINYGNSLVQYLGKDETLDSELLHHLNCILMKLQAKCDFMSEELVDNLWSKFESGTACNADTILNLPKNKIERVILNWINTKSSLQTEFLSKMSAGSPKLFQTVSSMLCGALTRTCGHKEVLELTNLFIWSVKRTCIREKRNFLKLYPKSCHQLVLLLMVSPKIYSEREENIVREVLSLLFKMFLTDRQKTFILLSHYSQWLSIFKAYVHVNAPASFKTFDYWL